MVTRKDQPSCPAMLIADFLQQQKQNESAQFVCEDHVIQDQEGQRSNLEIISRSEEENREEEIHDKPAGLR